MENIRRRLRLLYPSKVSFLTFLVFFVITNAADAAVVYTDARLTKNTVWENDVYVEGKLVVEKGVTLTIKPGTRVLFKKKDTDGDGISETTILVSGNIIASGTKEKPIHFTSSEEKKDWGDWKEIQINHATGVRFERCIFEYAEYGLHIHFSDVKISDCIFRHNNDATRLGNTKLVITRNLFEKNEGKALNFTNCDFTFKENTIRGNREGVFVFERPGKPDIHGNNIYDNDTDVKTGDFFKGALTLGENYFGKNPVIEPGIKYAAAASPYMGILPDWRDAYIVFQHDTEGFVDGEGGYDGNNVFFPSFDGRIYIHSLRNGGVRTINAGDFTDSAPLSREGKLYFLNWAGDISAVETGSGKTLWKANFKKTLKDDHRMPSPVLHKEYLAAVSPGGHLMVLNAETGTVVFERFLGAEYRAAPLVLSETAYFPSVSGVITTLNLDSFSISSKQFDAGFYSSPIVYNGLICFLDKSGNLFLTDEQLNIKKRIKLNGAFRHQSLVVLNNALYAFSLDGKIFKVSGESISEEKADEIFTATPVVYRGYIVAPCFSGRLYFYKSGKSFAVGSFGEVQFKPFAVNDLIFFGSRDNKIYAIKPW